MDYGKLAYLKAEDLSKRLDSLERKSDLGLKSIKLGASPYVAVSGSYLSPPMVFTSGGAGGITMILKMRFNHDSPRSLRVYATLNDMEFHSEQITLSAGQTDYFALSVAASGKDQQNNYLRIGIDGQGNLGVLESYEIVIWGQSLKYTEPDARLIVADGAVKKAAVILGGHLTVWQTQGQKFAWTDLPKVICPAADFGMSLLGNEALFAVIDSQKNLDLITESGINLARIDSGADSVAVFTLNSGEIYMIAYIKEGAIKVAEVNWAGEILTRYDASLTLAQPEQISAVADADRPMFLIKTAAGKIYFTCAPKTHTTADGIISHYFYTQFSTATP